METAFIRVAQIAKEFLSPETHVFFCAFIVILWLSSLTPGLRPRKTRRKARGRLWDIFGPLSLAWIIVLFSPLGSWALYRYERSVPVPARSALQGKTALVLGGNTVLFDTASSRMRWYANSERIKAPLELYRQGVLKKLVITGGQISRLSPRFLGEAASVAKWWEAMGVPSSVIGIEEKARNTHENFTLSQPLLPKGEEVVLITSAFQMPRALSVAKKTGLAVIAYPVDYKTSDSFDWWSWENLLNAKQLIFEWVGLVAYRVVGFSA